MYPTIEPLIHLLKSTREAKRLSQRALADKLGIPQSHLSKIEANHVNPRLTTFVEMARNLEMEVMLIPRQEVAMVMSLIISKEKIRNNNEIKPAYTLDDEKAHED